MEETLVTEEIVEPAPKQKLVRKALIIGGAITGLVLSGVAAVLIAGWNDETDEEQEDDSENENSPESV